MLAAAKISTHPRMNQRHRISDQKDQALTTWTGHGQAPKVVEAWVLTLIERHNFILDPVEHHHADQRRKCMLVDNRHVAAPQCWGALLWHDLIENTDCRCFDFAELGAGHVGRLQDDSYSLERCHGSVHQNWCQDALAKLFVDTFFSCFQLAQALSFSFSFNAVSCYCGDVEVNTACLRIVARETVATSRYFILFWWHVFDFLF